MELYRGIEKIYPKFWQTPHGRRNMCGLLLFSAMHGNVEMLKCLVFDFEVDVNHRCEGFQGGTLIEAVSKGHEKAALYLIEAGADLYFIDDKGATAVTCAVKNGMLALVKHMVLDKHMDSSAFMDESGHSLICLAATQGHKDIVRFFIEHFGRNTIDKPCNNSYSLLSHVVAQENGKGMARWLINDMQANPESPNTEDG